MKAKVESRFKHDGQVYKQGETFEGDAELVKALTAKGVLQDPKAKEEPQVEEDGEAKAKADTLVKEAEAKAKTLVEEAKAKADQLVKDAEAKADETRKEADDYAKEVRKAADEYGEEKMKEADAKTKQGNK